NNSGIVNVNLGTLAMNFPLTNTGTVNVGTGANLSGPITNNATINFNFGGPATWTVNSFTNSATGHVNILSDSATVPGSNSNSGNISVSPGAQLTINTNYQQLAGSSITGGGSVTLGNITNFAGSLGVTGPISITAPITFTANQSISGPTTATAII